MIRKPRDYTNHLRAEWKRRFPERPDPEAKQFNDEVLVAVDFVMRQIDPAGSKPVIMAPAYAEDYQPQPSARPDGKRGRARE